MALLEILHYPDSRLRQKALPVGQVDKEIQQFSKDMLETMYHEEGVGLAAVQVNRLVRVIVIDLSEDRSVPKVLVNPEVLHAEGENEMQEGCLSVPGYFDTVRRFQHIQYKYKDIENKEIIDEADGLLAVCIQHEIDHLDGKLFIDRLSSLKQQRLAKKFIKQEKLNSRVMM